MYIFIFVLFTSKFNYKLQKSVDVLLGTRTWGYRMVGAEGSTEQWRSPGKDENNKEKEA